MAEFAEPGSREVPPRALALSLASLAVPVLGALSFPEDLGEYGALLWLTALVPAFLLAYYRGWRGVATALALGMATLSVTQAVASWLGLVVPDILLGIVVAYLAISLGIGWVADRLHRDLDVVEDLAFTDILTRLPNRRHARMFLDNEFAAAERGHLLSVVLFDLDHFKGYNDEHGHAAGDEVLRVFAEILAENTRRMNLSARFGGEEFLSVLAGSDSEGAMVFAERVRSTLRSRTAGARPLTVSAGVAAYDSSMRSPDELLAAADHALYQAKRDGRNCVRLFGHPLLEEVTPDGGPKAFGPLDEGPERPPSEYPRDPEEMGKTRPPTTLLPHQITVFGDGRKVLLVEDEDHVRGLISSYLAQEGFQVTEATEAASGIRELAREQDIVITDIRLPGASGNELVAAAKSRWPTSQVIVITGLRDADVAAEALNAGADRYLFKPFGMSELRSHLVDALARRDRLLQEKGQEGGADEAALERRRIALDEVLEGVRHLVKAAETRDPHMRGHGARVARYATVLAGALEERGLAPNRPALSVACELHDLGKIHIADAILTDPGPLSEEDLQKVRAHPRTGRRILEPLVDDETILGVVSWHHERWDGGGYPDGLSGEAIPLEARIAAVADALDAMTSERSFREAIPWDSALERLRDEAGAQFDPDVIAAMDACVPDLLGIFRETVGAGAG